jgi:predicted lipoprotein
MGRSRDGIVANDGSPPMTRRLILSITAVAGVALVTWAFPLFHVVPLDKALESREQAHFDAAEFAETFWDERLMPALPRASEARAVLDAIDGDFQAARQRYGRTVGISNSYYVFIQGTGRVVDADPEGVGLAIRDGPTGPDVMLPVGLIFGNTVRDATGLLDMDKFPNSRHFNDIATELNRIVETRVLPQLRDRAEVGREIRFVGCAEVSNGAKPRKPLKVVPVRVVFRATEESVMRAALPGANDAGTGSANR